MKKPEQFGYLMLWMLLAWTLAMALLFVTCDRAEAQLFRRRAGGYRAACNCPMCQFIRAYGYDAWLNRGRAASYSPAPVTAPAPVTVIPPVAARSAPRAIVNPPPDDEREARLAAEFKAAATAGTPDALVPKMIQLAQIRDHDVVVDPGCGDGRLLRAALEAGAARAIGYEIDPEIAAQARENLRVAGFEDSSVVWTADSREGSWRADVALVYLYPETLAELKDNLKRCRVVVSYAHEVPGWTGTQITYGSDKFFVYYGENR